ncbi:cytochrome P450 [Streptomyces spongiicola]|uniref:Cytochrome P450 n=1 Tax=Streptomyces spongiicola TaxID=1690221 RepID=A0A2S1YU57_9ACTN|nr:cytochrome P450 [Streptomyces spongiicola]AWK07625.1 cytochrome P450 [Streptomyces spongiicola]GBQ02536.1 cytochrome P450 [Streptomyces spongiicola]
MTQPLIRQILDYDNRADPYPLYAELRETPVLHDGHGTYVVSTYWEILSLLHDPRVSSDRRKRTVQDIYGLTQDGDEGSALPPPFLRLDPPEHDRLRTVTNRSFGPPHSPRRVLGMRDELEAVVSGLIDGIEDSGRIDLVEQFSYPFPVTAICRLLGVPREDEPRFHTWADTLAASLDPMPGEDPTERNRRTRDAQLQLGGYLAELIEKRRAHPGDDMLSELAAGTGENGELSTIEAITTAALLLIAGHETTVNLITNGMLTLLRNPEVLKRLGDDPRTAPRIVEELLRYEPPVQLIPNRTAVADIDIAGATIPSGAALWLVPGSGNRDPLRFADPERFDPDREDIEHLGFGSGIHICFGAPLARQETELALSHLARRLHGPRLLEDPPPYRRNAVLRGPRHLYIGCDDIRP